MKKTIKVYWASDSADGTMIVNNSIRDVDWGILYKEPINLYQFLTKLKNKNSSEVLKCPAFINKTKNTFVIENPIESKIKIEDNQVFQQSLNGISSSVERLEPMFDATKMITYHLRWFFFTDEDSLPMTLSSPFFSHSPHLSYSSIFPGKFDIGKWFRVINLEFNIWRGDVLHLEEKEHIAYFEFDSDYQIDLIQFTMNPELMRIGTTLGNSSSWEKNVPLMKRYTRFKEAKYKERILKEIKNNTVSNLR